MGRSPSWNFAHSSIYPQGGSFAEIFEWHLYWGTRPRQERPEKRIHTNIIEFTWSIYITDLKGSGYDPTQNASNWRQGKSFPENQSILDKILLFFFDDDPALKSWSADLQQAWDEKRRPIPRDINRQRHTDNSFPLIFKTIPSPTAYFTGRDYEVEKLVSALLPLSPNSAVLVQGGPGIGKSTLTQKVAYDPRIITRFGKTHRCFVQLETAHSATAMQEAIAVAIGSDTSKPFSMVMEELQGRSALFILDNLETPWEKPKDLGGRRETEATLAALSAIPGVAILASFRGRDAVGGPPWTLRHHVEPLAAGDAAKLFCSITGDLAPDESNFEQLVGLLGGIPLAIELVATLAGCGTPIVEILRRWEEVGTELARHPDFGEGRLTSLPHSIELSLKSPRLSPEGYRLFQLLGQLPAGLAEADRDALFGGTGMQAASSLARTGLGVRRDARIDLLPPIRDHAARHHLPTDSVNSAWTGHFAQLAEALVDNAFSADGKEVRLRIISETPNIEAAIGVAIRHPTMLGTAITAARHYRRLLTHTGMGTTDLLKATADACQRAGDSISEAKVCVQIGILAQERGNLDEAWQILERGLSANHRASNATDVASGKGDCLYRMADIHLHRSKLLDARDLYLQARALYEICDNARGLGDCIYRLGDIEWRRANYDLAMTYVDEAEPQFARAKFDLGMANCAWLRARVALDGGDYDRSEQLHLLAQQRFEQIGVPLGKAHCRNGEGYIALGGGRLSHARQCLEEARDMYVDIKDERGIANCELGLAKVARVAGDLTTALTQASKALLMYEKSEAIDCVGRCYEELARISVDQDDIRKLANRARAAYVKAETVADATRVEAEFNLQ